MPKNREKLFSVTKKDLVFEYFSGTGAGGQHRNKCQNSCRCKHPASGAIGICQEGRSKAQNTRVAFHRMANSDEFQKWIRIEASRATGELEDIKKKVETEAEKAQVEIKKDGKWTKIESDEELTDD
jgi:protein subunit release factor B